MFDTFAVIPVMTGVDRARFEAEIVPAAKPVVLKGLVADWPVVKAAIESPEVVSAYLKAMDTSGKTTNVSVLPTQHKGRFFYKPDMDGFNFMNDERTVASVLDWLVTNRGRDDYTTLYVQSLVLASYMPRFDDENPLDLLPKSYGPRMWLGNKVRTQTHFDPSHNIACLVAGRRRFTLFPPEQIDNLYPGPFDVTPGGVPVSMASLEEPDFELHPRFRDALPTAQTAVLGPGDALFVPYGWWHHVQSLEGFNILVNYWWNDAAGDWFSPISAIYAAILSLRDLPASQKVLWKHMLDMYVFEDFEASVAHLPESARGAFGPLTPETRDRMRAFIKNAFRV